MSPSPTIDNGSVIVMRERRVTARSTRSDATEVRIMHHAPTTNLDEARLETSPVASSVIGLGGGQAIDVAEFVAWRRQLPLFRAAMASTVSWNPRHVEHGAWSDG
jgi:glycerol dehydrogenase-like iron-containing ADH family enzyme